MLKAVRAAWVYGLGDKIKEYNEAYGHNVWPLLYQCCDRFMKEQVPRILRRETLKLNAAIAAGRNILGEGLDATMPFDWIFELVVGEDNRGPAEDRWWRENFVDSMGPFMTGIVPLGSFVEGDAPVADCHADHIASSYASVLGSAFGYETGSGPTGDRKRRKTGPQGPDKC